MPETTHSIERLPDRLHEPVRAYAQWVQQTLRTDVAALVFYGLVVGDELDLSAQPARNVLVLEKVNLDVLWKLGEHGTRHAKAGIAAPVVMTPEYINRSLDTFPLELLEIQQQHVLIFGKDLFSDLTFVDAHLRMQCERELKVALLTMHDALLSTGGRDRLLHPVVANVAEGLVRIIRGIAWLKGIREPHPTLETVAAVEEAFARKLPGIHSALDRTQRHDWPAFKTLYDDVHTLGTLVDAL